MLLVSLPSPVIGSHSSQDCIEAKYLTGIIEGGGCHDQTINKGRAFVLGFLNGVEEGKRCAQNFCVAVGDQNISRFISFQEGRAGEYCLLSANVVANAVKRFRQY